MKKQVNCPHCGGRVAESDESVKTEIRILYPNIKWKADYYTKCWKCHTIVGLKKLNIINTNT